MTSRAILNQITTYANALKDAAKWQDSGTAVAKATAKHKDKKGGDYIYEFYCYVRILADLTHNYDVQFVEGSGNFKSIFPQAPSAKRGKPYFILKAKGTDEILFQVCAGTKISTRYSSRQPAPDISFQKPGASSSPKQSDVLAIFDAKFNRSASDKEKIGLEQLYYVAGIIRDLDLQNAQDTEILFNELTPLRGNCLLTNGGAHSNDAEYNKSHHVKEIEYFTVGGKFKAIG